MHPLYDIVKVSLTGITYQGSNPARQCTIWNFSPLRLNVRAGPVSAARLKDKDIWWLYEKTAHPKVGISRFCNADRAVSFFFLLFYAPGNPAETILRQQSGLILPRRDRTVYETARFGPALSCPMLTVVVFAYPW